MPSPVAPSPPSPAHPSRDDGYDLIHAHLLRGFPELVAELGGHADDLLRQAGLPPTPTSPDTPETISYRQLIDLLERAASQLACPDFGMRLARRQAGSSIFGPLGQAMRHSRTFGEALDYSASHSYAHSLAARVWLGRTLSGRHLFAGHDILLEGIPHRAQAIEQLLLEGHLIAQELTGGRAQARRVHFRHQPISPPALYRRYFGCEVAFGQNEDGVAYAARDLAAPIVEPDARALAEITRAIERDFPRRTPPLHAEARGLLMRMVGTLPCDNAVVAAGLGLHPRTLHRRLRQEGTSFQRIKDEVRRDILLYYLTRTTLPFTAISEKLGFAEQAVMSRKCRQWLGASPTALRTQAGRSEPLEHRAKKWVPVFGK